MIPEAVISAANELRTALCAEFRVIEMKTPLQTTLLQEIAKLLQDADVDIPGWLSGCTPIGIGQPITPRFLFQHVSLVHLPRIRPLITGGHSLATTALSMSTRWQQTC